MLTMHRGFEGNPVEKEHVLYVADGQNVRKLNGAKATKFLTTVESGTELRVTAAHSADAVLLDLAGRGVKLYYTHWHSTGIPKNLGPEEIAQRFAALPQDTFRAFIPRPDLADLRRRVQARHALMEYRKAAKLRLSAVHRNFGGGEEKPDYLLEAETTIEQDAKEFESPAVKALTALAKTLPECVLFNTAACVKDGWMTAATVAAYLGDLSRFPTVAALWHYCGQHVVNGKAPKRTKGQAGDWNPKVRTALWSWADSALKGRNPKWRPVYDRFLAEELVAHDVKCPNCKTKQGHCGARARRKITKEMLKEFYLTAVPPTNHVKPNVCLATKRANGEGHLLSETH